ncbi:Putative succinate-semialdehyde dehydrogenase [NADP(+)] [Corynebacterium deserti GIMN1.010]|uniref:Putative succinate-semialdehyde dehydrogenase [NADP(+)] n=1 Tax=Corynebacterium deserti GIMN1.010 TaxID=931089 RepID=A0A0M5IGI9_9CORY|nr:succinic semialdehyde dehydrogenase [Corynebacterium deserti]ALC06798.1 Putative succinate-semialdehyde dehydrogenase [NADP(+)] [Corynebacterium deserti GIMN1.010]
MLNRLPLGPLPAQMHKTLLDLCANSDDAPKVEVEAPFLGFSIGYVFEGSEVDVDEAFRRARAAQKEWALTSISDRKKVFRTFHDLVLKNRELLIDFIQLETGKNRASAADEVFDVAITARYYANQVEKLLADKKHPGALPVVTKNVQQQIPKGVVGQITPWNYPLTLGVSDAIPALLAGNAVVAKPDLATPFTCLIAVHLLVEAGLPRDLMQVVTGSGEVVGGAIAQHCDYLMFTGSTATGRILGRTMGERLVGFSAELGGKNPLIVAKDADLSSIGRELVQACFSNSGQLCVSIERIYVEAEVYEEVLDKFVRATKDMSIGTGFDWDVEMGSLIHKTQLERVSEFVEQARDAGATVLCGGRARADIGPYFYEPTVLVDVPAGTPLLTQEVFGPVVFVEKVSSLLEAVEKANATEYGLNASVFAAPETGRWVANQLEAGGVGINDGYAATWASVSTPLGGMKQSGVGRRHGAEGLLKYTETRNVAEQRVIPLRGPAWLRRKAYSDVLAWALKMGKTLKVLP